MRLATMLRSARKAATVVAAHFDPSGIPANRNLPINLGTSENRHPEG